MITGEPAGTSRTTGWYTSSFMTTRVAPAPSRSGRRAPILVEVLTALLGGERPRHLLPGDLKEVVNVERPDSNSAAARHVLLRPPLSRGEFRAVRAEGHMAYRTRAWQNEAPCPRVRLEQSNSAVVTSRSYQGAVRAELEIVDGSGLPLQSGDQFFAPYVQDLGSSLRIDRHDPGTGGIEVQGKHDVVHSRRDHAENAALSPVPDPHAVRPGVSEVVVIGGREQAAVGAEPCSEHAVLAVGKGLTLPGTFHLG